MCISKSKILEKGFKSMDKNPVQFIADRSQENFRWVKIVLNILKNKTSTKDFQEVVETIPKDLRDIYDQLLTRLDASGSLELALMIIRCVLFPIQTLNIGEIEVAVNILQGDVIDLRDLAYTARSILSPPPDSLLDGRKWRERLFPRNENEITYKQGWTFQYSGDGEVRHNITLEQLQELADATTYNSNISVQCGNYAFSEQVAGSDHCIQSFQNAIDEQPECWQLYEGLGSYYEQNGKREDTIRCYSETMKVDTKNPASAAFGHWNLVPEKKEEEDGDSDGAIEAWKTGVANVPDKFAGMRW
ncbi:hypothetical protein ACEPPN_007010 [Leptodophora sp. 'Broadleaf-Isolate-01']